MKILQICSARQLGGGERHLADLANSLARRGHAIYAAVAPGSPLIPELHAIPKENITEVRMRNALDIFAAARIARVVREFGIDVIHAHVARDYPLAAVASSRTGGTPFVLTRHMLFPLSTIHRVTLRNAGRIIAVSNAVAESLRMRSIIDPQKIVTIHNGIDTARFARDSGEYCRPACLDGVNAPLLVGMVGHLSPIKGQEEFIRAAGAIAARRDDVDFVVIGDDKSLSGENKLAIVRLIERLDLVGRVHLVGWQDDVPPLLHAMDVFVSPSRAEPFGLAIVEAMASGVPVVATASEGALEIIEDGVTGKLISIGDTDGLVQAIINLLDDPAAREQLSAAALEAVNEQFSLEKMVDATEQILGDVITHARP